MKKALIGSYLLGGSGTLISTGVAANEYIKHVTYPRLLFLEFRSYVEEYEFFQIQSEDNKRKYADKIARLITLIEPIDNESGKQIFDDVVHTLEHDIAHLKSWSNKYGCISGQENSIDPDHFITRGQACVLNPEQIRPGIYKHSHKEVMNALRFFLRQGRKYPRGTKGNA